MMADRKASKKKMLGREQDLELIKGEIARRGLKV